MDKLWAPWRVDYVSKIIKKHKGCVFCKILKQKKDVQNYIFARTKFCFAVLNIYPYNNGHILVMPYRHVSDINKLKREEKLDLYDLMEETKDLLDESFHPNGFNIGINVGKYAGAGYPGHIHIHLVPRWRGDVNFMPVVGNTKVISQSLKASYKQLSNAYKKRHRSV